MGRGSWLIRQIAAYPTVFGESRLPALMRWSGFDIIQPDWKEAGYAVKGLGYARAGVGAPHIRQRFWSRGRPTTTDAIRFPAYEFKTSNDAEPRSAAGGTGQHRQHGTETRQRRQNDWTGLSRIKDYAGRRLCGPVRQRHLDADLAHAAMDKWRPVEPEHSCWLMAYPTAWGAAWLR